MTDPHEDLVEAVEKIIKRRVSMFNLDTGLSSTNDEALSREAIALIAERTIDATPEMIDAFRQMQADQHFGVTTLWTAMHRASALFSQRDQ